MLNEPVPSIRNQNNQDGSERKNPLAYLLASANASVDTTNNNNQRQEPASDNMCCNMFREEPAVEVSNSQVNVEDSVLNILDRFSSMRVEDHIN